jgi:hypothetical protein
VVEDLVDLDDESQQRPVILDQHLVEERFVAHSR